MIEQQTNNEHQIHIDVLPTDKFKTTMITFKFMAPLEYETITNMIIVKQVVNTCYKKMVHG